MTAPGKCGMTAARSQPKVSPKSVQAWPKVGQESPQSRPKVGQKSAQSRPKVGQKSAKSRPKAGQRPAQSRFKVSQKSSQSRPQVGPGHLWDDAVIPQVWDDRPVRPGRSSHLKMRYGSRVLICFWSNADHAKPSASGYTTGICLQACPRRRS